MWINSTMDQTTATLKKDEKCIKAKRNLKTTYYNKPPTPIPISIYRKQYINLNGKKKWKKYRTSLTSVVTTWYHSKYHWILIFSQNQSLFVSSYPVGMYPEECKVKYHSCSVCLTHLVDHTYTHTSSSTSFISPGGSLSFLSLFHTHTHTHYTHYTHTHLPSASELACLLVFSLAGQTSVATVETEWSCVAMSIKRKWNTTKELHCTTRLGSTAPWISGFRRGGVHTAHNRQWERYAHRCM